MHKPITRVGVRVVLVVAMVTTLAAAGASTAAGDVGGDAVATDTGECACAPTGYNAHGGWHNYYVGCAEADASGDEKSVCYKDVRKTQRHDYSGGENPPEERNAYCATVST